MIESFLRDVQVLIGLREIISITLIIVMWLAIVYWYHRSRIASEKSYSKLMNDMIAQQYTLEEQLELQRSAFEMFSSLGDARYEKPKRKNDDDWSIGDDGEIVYLYEDDEKVKNS